MTHTLTVTETDFVCAQRLHARTLNARAIVLLVVTVIVLAGAVEGQLSVGEAIGALAGMFGWMAILYLVILPSRSKHIYRQQKSLHLKHSLWWDNEMLFIQSRDSEERIRWPDFIKVKENSKMLLLYRSDMLFNIIPKHCFTQCEDLEAFKSCLSAVPKG